MKQKNLSVSLTHDSRNVYERNISAVSPILDLRDDIKISGKFSIFTM